MFVALTSLFTPPSLPLSLSPLFLSLPLSLSLSLSTSLSLSRYISLSQRESGNLRCCRALRIYDLLQSNPRVKHLIWKSMVQAMRSGKLQQRQGLAPRREKVPVKLEMEDSLEEDHGPLTKRSKLSSNLQQEWSSRTSGFPISPSQYNPLDEPSPLGLRLRKSPSLLDLIQMRLSQGDASDSGPSSSDNFRSGGETKKDNKAAAPSGEKLKASNFPASLLRIGSWEYASRYEGDLVAKCYFAKHKLVWEVLDGGLKSKIEVQWSDIMGLRANFPDNGPGTLNVVLARQPLFFRETNPQPRKHTLWQATADFTDGQASTYRVHFVQCPQGVLNKHFEKLIQCDMRLNFLSQQPEVVLETPYFERQASVFEDPSTTNPHGLGKLEAGSAPNISGFSDVGSSSMALSSSLNIPQQDHLTRATERLSREAPSPSSVMDTHATEGNGTHELNETKMSGKWEQQAKVMGLRPSMSISDFMSQIEHCISEQINCGNPSLLDGRSECRDMLEDIAQHLLSDTHLATASDEKSLMSRVNSLCCLLQKDSAAVQSLQAGGEGFLEGNGVQTGRLEESMQESKTKDDIAEGEHRVPGSKLGPSGMSRKDSFGDLLLQLPRIASLPKFLFNISEDGESRAR